MLDSTKMTLKRRVVKNGGGEGRVGEGWPEDTQLQVGGRNSVGTAHQLTVTSDPLHATAKCREWM